MPAAGLRTAPAAAAHPHAQCLTRACKPFRSPCKQSMTSFTSTTRSARIGCTHLACIAYALATTRHAQCTDAHVAYLACMSPAPVQAHAGAQLTWVGGKVVHCGCKITLPLTSYTARCECMHMHYGLTCFPMYLDPSCMVRKSSLLCSGTVRPSDIP